MALTSKDIGLDEEQKPDNHLARNAGIIGMGVAIGWSRLGNIPLNWMDYSAIAVFLLLLCWCLTPSRHSSASNDAGDGFALRLGKLCKRALGRSKRRGIST